MAARLRDEAVVRRRWLDERTFLDLFAAVSLLPGPSWTQLAIVLSRRRAGRRGLLLGGVCFIAPAMTIVCVLAWLYTRYGTTPTGGGVLYGVEPVIVAVVAIALRELARNALHRKWTAVIALVATGCYFAGINILVPLLFGGLAEAVIDNRRRLSNLHILVPVLPMVSARSAARLRPGVLDVLAEFAKLGVVVFGSGYVLLAFLRADLVTHLHWLTEQQVLDAVAAGQVTPGPVFTTATFVGYLLGGLPLAFAATAGIFVPSFVMVAVLEPHVGRIRRSPWLGPALDGVTAAALGLMAGVTIDLGHNAITDAFTAVLGLAALIALLRWRPNTVLVVAAGAAAGIAHALLT